MLNKVRLIVLLVVLTVVNVGVAVADSVVVGGKDFTEQFILAEMTQQFLDANGFDVEKRDGMGSTILRHAQVNGQVDIVWAYTGTSLLVYNKKSRQDRTPREVYELVKRLDKKKGLIWLKPSDANNTYALAVNENNAKTADVKTISDLAGAYRKGRKLRFAHAPEFAGREDGLPGLMKAYNFRIPRSVRVPVGESLQFSALHEGEADVAVVYSTDGRIPAFGFRILEDNRNFFPDYSIAPVVRASALEKYPRLRKLLNEMSAKLNDTVMQRLNEKVDVENEVASKVAHEFLKKQDMIK